MNRNEVIAKLNKLKAFLERDCGIESDNAKRIAERLMKEHNISTSEFSYFWHSDPIAKKAKAEEEAKSARVRKAKAEEEAHSERVRKDFADMMNAAMRKQKEAHERAQRERAEREANARSREANSSARNGKIWERVSYSSYMRQVILDLLQKMNIRVRANGAKIEAEFDEQTKKEFNRRWHTIKCDIQDRMSSMMNDICKDI